LGPFESQTLPKARGGRVFNFTTTTTTNKCDGGGFSSLIEALSLLPGAHINDEGECKTNRGEDKNKGGYVNNKPFELQNPPIGKVFLFFFVIYYWIFKQIFGRKFLFF